MDWVEDAVARWLRIIAASGYGSTPLDEAVRVINETGDAARGRSRFSKPKRDVGEPDAVTALSRLLIGAVLVSDLLTGELCAATDQSRDQVLGHLHGRVPRQARDEQLNVLRLELSDSGKLLRGPEVASYARLGERVEQVLRLAAEQAAELVEAARAEAARITSEASERQPCPQCGHAQ